MPNAMGMNEGLDAYTGAFKDLQARVTSELMITSARVQRLVQSRIDYQNLVDADDHFRTRSLDGSPYSIFTPSMWSRHPSGDRLFITPKFSVRWETN